MFTKSTAKQAQPKDELPIGRRFLKAQGLDRDLPRRLLEKPDGRPYREIQLAQPQLQYLQRSEPVGGWEALIHENERRYLDRALQALEERIVEGAPAMPVQTFLESVIKASQDEERVIKHRLQALQNEYAQVNGQLESWQKAQARERDWLAGLWSLIQALLGGRISLGEAVGLWNRRESLAKERDAHRAAAQVLARFIETAEGFARSLEAVLTEARRAGEQARQEARRVAQALEDARPWGYQVDHARIAQALSDAGQGVGLLRELVAAAREGGSQGLLKRAKELARQEAQRRLADLDIVRLIELEGRYTDVEGLPADGLDPVILVGEALLDRVRRRHPTWQLVPSARPRVETLQLVPDGQGVYDHPELTTAAYGERTDRLGFLQVQMEVALEELRLAREGTEAFREALARREYFVLEEVAEAWQESSPFGHSESEEAQEPEPSEDTRVPEAIARAPGDGAGRPVESLTR